MTIPQERREELRDLGDELIDGGTAGAEGFLAGLAILNLLDALAAAEHRATRAEARANAKALQAEYWGDLAGHHEKRASAAEARLQAVRDVLAQYAEIRYPDPAMHLYDEQVRPLIDAVLLALDGDT